MCALTVIAEDSDVDEGTVFLKSELCDGFVSQRPYRVPDRLKDGVKREIDLLLESNIIEPSESAWALVCL